MASEEKKVKSPEVEKEKDEGAEREEQLHREFEALDGIHNELRKRASELRIYNEALQRNISDMQREIALQQEYSLHMSQQSLMVQSQIDALDEQTQQKLQELTEQRKEMIKRHRDRVTEIKKKIKEKEMELTKLTREVDELRKMEAYRKQLLERINELEMETVAARLRYVETVHDLRVNYRTETKRHTTDSQHIVVEFSHKVNKELPLTMLTYMRQMTDENHRMRQKLLKLTQRVQALRNREILLHNEHGQLLVEREFREEMARMRNSPTQEESSKQ